MSKSITVNPTTVDTDCISKHTEEKNTVFKAGLR